MAKHIKPTKEELNEGVLKSIEEAEKLKDVPVVEEDTPEPEKTPIKVIQPDVEEEVETPEEDIQEPEVEEEPETPPSEEIKEALKVEVKEKDKKLSASARENQKIYAKNRVINKAIIEAESIPEPTEEELIAEYKDWDVMSDIERTLAKETVITKRWRGKIKEAGDQATKIEKWNESVEAFIEDPAIITANPVLEGKQEAFAEFASQPENNSVPFKILVSAFLFEESTKKGNKGQMFPTGSGGPNDKGKPKSDKLTIEEGRVLRETNYDEWKKALKEKRIESDF